MTNLTTVVTLLTLRTVSRHMAKASASIASLTTGSSTTTTTTAAKPSTKAAAAIAAAATIGAIASYVTDLATFVALSPAATTIATTGTTGTTGARILTVTRDMARITATVACLFFSRKGAFTAHMALLATVVARGSAPFRTVSSLMRSVTTIVAPTGTACRSSEFHREGSIVRFSLVAIGQN